jgi:RNA polymerase sigma factor (sigma-70 family)
VRALCAATGSYEGVEDAIQDAFASAIHRAPADLRSVEGWLYSVALNRLRSQHRKLAVLRRLRLAPPPSSTDLDRVVQRTDISILLGALTSRERELLVAKHYIGMTQDEIATYMRLPRGTVSAAISRAVARFRELETKR